jgi:type VI secretion system secreted protein VgrG
MLQFLTDRTLTISGPAIPLSTGGAPVLQLRALHGSETVSTIYTYVLDCVSASDLMMDDAANLDLKSLIGKELTVTIQLDGMGSFVPGMTGLSGPSNIGKGIREISGIVTEARYVGQSTRQGQYRLLLQPWIRLADQQSNYRIFQNKTVVEIVDQVLGFYMFSWDKRLSAEYKSLAYQVQYGETDFAFVQRLMQEHGIYWFYEHSNGIHRMVLVDQLGAHKPVDSEAYQTLSYYPPGHKIDREYIDTFDASESIQSGRWTTGDFNFKKPKARLEAENALPRDTQYNELEHYEWPGDYSDLDAGEEFAQIRMQEIHAHGSRAWGGGNLRDVVCGTTFTLHGYPQKDANREYLVLGATFVASELGESTGAGEFHVRSTFVVQPATVVFRPPRTIQKPRTRGPQTATVTGPEGHEIWTDQYGRVKLKFHWDRSPVRDQNSSCWVRVSYPWAGNNYGTISIPRVGSEVIVDFENGDPDRPIIIGRVYNGSNMPPWTLPDNATQSGTLSRSSEGGGYGTANAIRFEDKKGQEQLWIHAERDLLIEVERDEVHAVQMNRTRSTGADDTTDIAGVRTVKVQGVEQHVVNGAQQTTLNGGHSLTVNGGQTVSVNGSQSISATANVSVTAGAQMSFLCGASSIVMDSSGTVTISGINVSVIAAGTLTTAAPLTNLKSS